MTRWTLAAGALFAAACALSASGDDSVKMLTRPAYKLYTICSKKGQMTQDDLRILAQNFQVLHGKLSPDQFAVIHRFNPDFKCLHYINSTYTRSSDQIRIVESKYRGSLCMHLSARLAVATGPDDTQLQIAATDDAVKHGSGSERIAIRASTVSGDFSSTDSDRPSTQYYVFWIRVDDELMRVNAFDEKAGRLEVTRGFSQTKPAAHAADAQIFSPVYLGFKRTGKDKYPGEHPGGPGDHLRYVMDPEVPAGYRFLADVALEQMSELGTDGVWLDTFNTGDFNLSDCLGQAVRPWNFSKHEVYSPDDFRQGQEKKVAFLQQFLREKMGHYPYLVANNLKPTTYYPGHGGMRFLLASTEVKPRPLDGFCMEGGLSWQKADDEEENLSWRSRISILMDAAQNGLAAMPILGGAGAASVHSEPDTPQRDKIERFGYASYLLAVEKNGKTMMGTYAFYRQGKKRWVKVHPMYYYPIGDPEQTVKPAEIQKYLLAGTKVYERKFSNGLVLVNPSGTDSARLDLGGAFIDPDTKQTVRSISMAAGTGKILLRRLDD